MRLSEKRYAIFRALGMQARTGRPSLTVRNTPTCSCSPTKSPMNKSARLKKRPMDEAQKLEVFKRTGSMPWLEVLYS